MSPKSPPEVATQYGEDTQVSGHTAHRMGRTKISARGCMSPATARLRRAGNTCHTSTAVVWPYVAYVDQRRRHRPQLPARPPSAPGCADRGPKAAGPGRDSSSCHALAGGPCPTGAATALAAKSAPGGRSPSGGRGDRAHHGLRPASVTHRPRVAEILNLRHDQVLALIHAGDIPATKIARHYTIPATWLAKATTGPSYAPPPTRCPVSAYDLTYRAAYGLMCRGCGASYPL
jgi:hypothetical protein